MSSNNSWILPFIANLKKVAEDNNRHELAQIRNLLTDHPATGEMWVYSHLQGAGPEEEVDAAILIAKLFVLHPDEKTQGPGLTLAKALRQLATKDNQASLDRRMARLLDCHDEDLGYHLQQTIKFIHSQQKAGHININWERLLADILNWKHENRWVQRRWASDFWAARDANSNQEPSTDDNEQVLTSKGE